MAASETQPRKGVSRGTTLLFTPLCGVHGAGPPACFNPSALRLTVHAPGDVPLCYLLELDGVCVLLGACASV